MINAINRIATPLRDPSHFQWAIVPMLAFVIYIYAVEIERRNWRTLSAGLAFYGTEWLAEIANATWGHFSDTGPLWRTPADSTYVILVGLNIEISLMFAIYGIVVAKILSTVKSRWLVIVGFSVFCAIVELILHSWGALTWDHWWWGWPNMWTVIVFAYAPGTIIAVLAFDSKPTTIKRVSIAALFAIDATLIGLGVGILGWI
ncbi:hypothetical protein ACFWC5_42655 [Streptomyces sp. NPDC060085]|uniref:hypothetical protein n=1 Tax=Streptomyces sp. NPDC060085 TaxID=3347054 RepID=UPI00364BC070